MSTCPQPAGATDLPTLRQRLAEAEQAHHNLLCGYAAVSVSGSGSSVTYTAAQVGALAAYVHTLRAQIATLEGRGGSARRPIYC